PGHTRHRDVEDGEVDILGERALDSLGAVGGLRDDLEVRDGVEDHLEPVAYDLVVVRKEDARLERRRHGVAAGTRSSTVVPRPGSDETRSDPPASSARSRMPASPAVFGGSGVGRPTPSSVTRRTTSPAAAVNETLAFEARAWRAAFVRPSCATR